MVHSIPPTVHKDQSGATSSPTSSSAKPRLTGLALGALGIVYGDIGTSPLYTIKECFSGEFGVAVTPANITGILSMVFWSLIIVVSLKYVSLILRADNKGEGGTFSLLAMLRGKLRNNRRQWAVLTILAAFGASLLYGDGVITPAISVLSAIEGLNMATDAVADYVVPTTCLILIVLFSVQRFGTAVIGRMVGPVMIVWFTTLGLLGLRAIASHPEILAALNPACAVNFFAVNHIHGIVSLASVVLCITGCEALYADMGHFGPLPIRLSWYGIVLPGLVLNYFGQGALLLHDPDIANVNPFYALAPKSILYPLVGLACISTIIASQALISGVFSLTQQAIQLGFAPRMRIIHTSEHSKGQIYIPTVNWAVMIATLTLVLVFEKSSGLAAAYGFAVTATMTVTSLMFFQVTLVKWHWSLWKSACLLGFFLFFDLAFLGANVLKIPDGGWITICIATVLATSMITWRDGRALLANHYRLMRLPTDVFLRDIVEHSPPRITGTAVFMSISPDGIPYSLVHYLKHTEALHERILLLSAVSIETPTVVADDRVTVKDLGEGLYRITVGYGFMESPDISKVIEQLSDKGLSVDIYSTSFFLGRENLLATGPAKMAQWRKHLFIFMSRNAWNASSFFKLPPDRVVELGNQVEL
ncbi:potassium transporter Kup [Desulfopila sp. IMCC35006]|uniref:potassium transporter Kup n=1 Tax=Desulfopila sp. IMCC35006 TaxID=2569542 RepID=UPI0010AC37FA|nr:potassium transporter Kup [Desulfopila sp. IMCC35006]TKB28230.1 potassium transporter Kup [Desulfopila sp. IMCC35006]